MSLQQSILALLQARDKHISIDEITRLLDLNRIKVRATLLILYSRKQVVPNGDLWRSVRGGIRR